MKKRGFLFLSGAFLFALSLLFAAQGLVTPGSLRAALLEVDGSAVTETLSRAVEKAGKRAKELIGEAVPLSVSVNPSGARAIYTCRNGYVLADLITGDVIEFSLSLPVGEGDIGEEACVEAARAFLGGGAEEIEPAAEPDAPGFLRLRFGETILVVKRDTGRVVFYLGRGS